MEFTHSNGINIPHLSPSTVNSFITNRQGFINNKILLNKFEGNKFTARGTAIEHAINEWIVCKENKNYLKIALDKYDEELSKSQKFKSLDDSTKDAIGGLLDVALNYYKLEFNSVNVITQQKLTMDVEGVDREVLMYLDFFIPDKKVIDCKTASRTPSELSQSYIIQGACYQHATKLPVEFDFFIDNKKPVHKKIELTQKDYKFGMSYFIQAAKIIEEIEQCDSTKRMLELMAFPDLSSMYDYNERSKTAEKWNIEI